MDVRSCKNCGRLFNYLQGPPICPACRRKMEDKFVEVREYIRENDSATMQEIAEATEVTVKQLKQWVREERLTFSSKSPVGIECESCGTMIRTGRYCEKCKNDMAANLTKMYAVEPPKKQDKAKTRDKDRMRFLDKS